MGGWYLESAVHTWLGARRQWPAAYACLLYLRLFILLETLVLVAFRQKLRLDAVLAWPYILVLAIASIAALAGIPPG